MDENMQEQVVPQVATAEQSKVAEVGETVSAVAKQQVKKAKTGTSSAARKAQEAVDKADGRFSKVIVVSAVTAIMLFMVATFTLEVLNILYGSNVQLPVEVNTGYFAFWTVEIVMLATIRKSKVKNRFHYTEAEYEKGVPEQ